jgi:hypothetical protein
MNGRMNVRVLAFIVRAPCFAESSGVCHEGAAICWARVTSVRMQCDESATWIYWRRSWPHRTSGAPDVVDANDFIRRIGEIGGS